MLTAVGQYAQATPNANPLRAEVAPKYSKLDPRVQGMANAATSRVFEATKIQWLKRSREETVSEMIKE